MVLGTCSPFAHSAGPQLCLLGAGSTSPSSASLLTRVSKGSERSCMRRKMRPLANWYSQNLSPNSWGQLEPLFPAQPQQPGQMLGLFLLVLPGSSQAELPLVWGGQRGREEEGPEREVRLCCAENCSGSVPGSCKRGCPGSTSLTLLMDAAFPDLWLISLLSPHLHEILVCFLSHSKDVTSSSLTWPGLGQLSLCLASPWREVCLASNYM